MPEKERLTSLEVEEETEEWALESGSHLAPSDFGWEFVWSWFTFFQCNRPTYPVPVSAQLDYTMSGLIPEEEVPTNEIHQRPLEERESHSRMKN